MGMRHQIVRVISINTLVTPDLTESVYTTPNRQPLKPGIYTVLWPARVRDPLYDEDAKYIGPFKTVAHARRLVRLCVAEYFREKGFNPRGDHRTRAPFH